MDNLGRLQNLWIPATVRIGRIGRPAPGEKVHVCEVFVGRVRCLEAINPVFESRDA
jgi:hypothetical protein